jgi:hypothetical protein
VTVCVGTTFLVVFWVVFGFCLEKAVLLVVGVWLFFKSVHGAMLQFFGSRCYCLLNFVLGFTGGWLTLSSGSAVLGRKIEV